MFTEYEAAGLKLCAIERGKKAPVYDGWNVTPMPAESIEALGGGAGLLHSLSGTCALDIDDLTLARPWLAERGFDVDAYLGDPTSVMISSGRPGRGKLLYRMARPKRSLKPKGSGIELRCATAAGLSVQDVLPPTIHPVTNKPYEWKYGDELIGHWSNIPPIPAALARIWRDLIETSPVMEVTGQRVGAPIEIVRKAFFQHVERAKVDVGDYDQWLQMGMRLHEETGGSAEGLEVWDDWSKTDHGKRASGGPRYEGYLALKAKWLTFGQAGGNHVGMKGMIRELPAEASEFDVVPTETPPADNPATKPVNKRAEALAEIEKKLIYVRKSEKYFDTTTHSLIMTESGLQNLFMPLMPKAKGGGRLDPVKELKASTTKRIVHSLGFHPGEGPTFKVGPFTYANLYKNMLPEPLEPTAEEMARIDWLLDRIDDPVFREYYIQFMGHVVQRPGVKIKSAPLIWSKTQRNGKSTLMQRVPQLLVGAPYSKELSSKQLEDGFNAYLADAWHVNLAEFRAGSKGEREAIAKKVEAWIADDFIPVRAMHQVAYTMPNRFFVTASSNFEDAAAIDNTDKKWAIHEYKHPLMTPAEVKYIYTDFLETERAPAVLRWYFLRADISTFVATGKAPETAAKDSMVAGNMPSDQEWLIRQWEARDPPFDRDIVITGDVTAMVCKAVVAKPNAWRVGKLLAGEPFNGVALKFRDGKGTKNGIVLWNVEKWKAAGGAAIVNHIAGNDVDVATDDEIDPLLT